METSFSRDLRPFYQMEGIPVCPLTVGVTGHRNLEPSCREKVREEVRKFLQEACRVWTKFQKKSAPLLVFDGLAEGSDQLVAEVVYELRQLPETACLRLVAVLPMPLEEYAKDFDTPESLADFQKSLKQADALVEIPLTDANLSLQASGASFNRIVQYEQLGKYLTRSTFLTLALWDGKNLEAPVAGGTADVVRMKLVGDTQVKYSLGMNSNFWIHSAKWEATQPYGSVFQIATPRIGKPIQDSAGTTWWWYREKSTEVCKKVKNPSFNEMYTELQENRRKNVSAVDFFATGSVREPMELLAKTNRDTLAYIPEMKAEQEKSQIYLLGDVFCPVPDGNLKFLVDFYQVFDTLAMRFQTLFKRISVAYIVLGILLAVLFYIEAFSKAFPLDPIRGNYDVKTYRFQWEFSSPLSWEALGALGLDMVYLLVVLVLLACYIYYTQRQMYYERYHRYRAVAEAIRVQIFWYMGGISERVMDNYHYHPINSLDWQRNTINTILIPLSRDRDFPEDHPQRSFFYDHWVHDQEKFYLDKLRFHSERSKVWNQRSRYFAMFAVVWLILRIFINRFGFVNAPLLYGCYGTLAVLWASCGSLAVGCYLFSRFRCYDSLSSRYGKIFPIFSAYAQTMRKEMEQKTESLPEKLREELYRIGIYALTENADWFLIQRKLDFPK